MKHIIGLVFALTAMFTVMFMAYSALRFEHEPIIPTPGALLENYVFGFGVGLLTSSYPYAVSLLFLALIGYIAYRVGIWLYRLLARSLRHLDS